MCIYSLKKTTNSIFETLMRFTFEHKLLVTGTPLQNSFLVRLFRPAQSSALRPPRGRPLFGVTFQ